MLMNSLSEAALGWRHQAVQTWSAVMWHIAWTTEQRADRLHRQTCCSWSLEVVDSTLSYFPFRATQLRCTACFPPLSASEPITHLRRSFSAVFSFPSTKWTNRVPTECKTLIGLIWWLCKLMATFCVQEDIQNTFWSTTAISKILALMVHRHKGKDQYVVLCMFR